MRRHGSKQQRGFSLIELLIVVAIIGIVTAIAIPNLLASRRAANDASAISAIRSLSSAEETWRATIGSGTRFTNMAGLLSAQMIDEALGGAATADDAKSGYVYSVVTTSADDTNFCAGAAPATVNTGTRNFSSDAPGVVYVHALSVASPPQTTAGGVALNN